MRARVVEMNLESGFGKATLESGETLSFDVSVSRLGIPEVGAEMDVETGPSGLGGLRITRAEIIPTWEAIELPTICIRIGDDSHATFLSSGGSETVLALSPEYGHLAIGSTGLLRVEKKRGAQTFTERRIAGWIPQAPDESLRKELLNTLHTFVRETWAEWEDPDFPHTQFYRDYLQELVFVAHDLGLDVEPFLTIHDYPVDEVMSVHDARAYGSMPEVPRATRRLSASREG